MTISMLSISLKTLSASVFHFIPPCCFYTVTYKLSANNFSTIFSGISNVKIVPDEQMKAEALPVMYMAVVFQFCT